MILCLDVGNSHIYGGVLVQDEIVLRFRYSSKMSTSDELGLFLKQVLRENQFEPTAIQHVAICSVVPSLDYSLRSAIVKYFSLDPFFLQVGVKTGLQIKYRNPVEVGADRIANSIAAIQRFPKQNLIIVDFGTATTFCVISAEKVYLGGAIIPGMRLSSEALSLNTAKLPSVEIIQMQNTVGRSTIESIQSGLFFGALGSVREIITRIKQEAFPGGKVLVLATGGFAWLFDKSAVYDHHLPDLVLHGMLIALRNNMV